MNGIRIVCAPSGGPLPYFVECEDENGRSFCAGVWRNRADGMRELVVRVKASEDAAVLESPADVRAEEGSFGEGAHEPGEEIRRDAGELPDLAAVELDLEGGRGGIVADACQVGGTDPGTLHAKAIQRDEQDTHGREDTTRE